MSINIRVKNQSNIIAEIKVHSNYTISEVKKEILDQTKIEIDQQKLIYAGKVLEDDKTVSDYNIEVNDTVHLIIVPFTIANVFAKNLGIFSNYLLIETLKNKEYYDKLKIYEDDKSEIFGHLLYADGKIKICKMAKNSSSTFEKLNIDSEVFSTVDKQDQSKFYGYVKSLDKFYVISSAYNNNDNLENITSMNFSTAIPLMIYHDKTIHTKYINEKTNINFIEGRLIIFGSHIIQEDIKIVIPCIPLLFVIQIIKNNEVIPLNSANFVFKNLFLQFMNMLKSFEYYVKVDNDKLFYASKYVDNDDDYEIEYKEIKEDADKASTYKELITLIEKHRNDENKNQMILLQHILEEKKIFVLKSVSESLLKLIGDVFKSNVKGNYQNSEKKKQKEDSYESNFNNFQSKFKKIEPNPKTFESNKEYPLKKTNETKNVRNLTNTKKILNTINIKSPMLFLSENGLVDLHSAINLYFTNLDNKFILYEPISKKK